MFFCVYNQHLSVPTEERPLLAGAIMNYVWREEPGTDKAKQYLASNRELIIEKAKALHVHNQMRDALRYSYAAQIVYLHLSVQSGNELAESRIAELFQRAQELSIAVPDCKEICGSDNADDCIAFLRAYAKTLRETNRVAQ